MQAPIRIITATAAAASAEAVRSQTYIRVCVCVCVLQCNVMWRSWCDDNIITALLFAGAGESATDDKFATTASTMYMYLCARISRKTFYASDLRDL